MRRRGAFLASVVLSCLVGEGCGNPYTLLGLGDRMAAAVGGPITDFAFADLAGDGKAQLVALNTPGESLTIISCCSQKSVGFVTPASKLISADVNLDGRSDLVLTAADNKYIRVMTSTGSDLAFNSADFQLASGGLTAPLLLAPGERVQDGTVYLSAGQMDDASVRFLRSRPFEGFTEDIGFARVSYDSEISTMASGPLGSSPTVKLVIGLARSKKLAVVGWPTGTEAAATIALYPVGIQPQKLILLDATVDGLLDAMVLDGTNAKLALLAGQADGSLAPPIFYDINTGATDMAAGDINGDGNLDVVLAYPGASQFGIVLGIGRDSTIGAVYPAQEAYTDVALADWNKDGALDVITINRDDGRLGIFTKLGQ